MAGSSECRWPGMAARHHHTGADMIVVAASPVHGLVHVVAPGRAPASARTRAAAAVPARAPAPTRRAPAGARAAAAARAHAPGIEDIS